jgi:hypothetical protein
MPGEVVDGIGGCRFGRVLRTGGRIGQCHRETPPGQMKYRTLGDDLSAHIAEQTGTAPARSRRAGALPLRAEASDGVPCKKASPNSPSRPTDAKHSNIDMVPSARNSFRRPLPSRRSGHQQNAVLSAPVTGRNVPSGLGVHWTLRAPIYGRPGARNNFRNDALRGSWGGIFPMMPPKVYRSYAAECLRCAMRVTDPASRSSLRRMALAWADLADQAERNARNDVVYESPARERREG